MTLVTAALISSDDFVNVAHWSMCAWEAAQACPLTHCLHRRNFWKAFWLAPHTASRVAPSDPRLRAATVGGFTFGGSDPPYCILAVQDGKSGITTIPGQLMGKNV